MEFGYWAIKGRGEVTRMIAAYSDISLNEKNPSGFEEWGHWKAKFDAPFANLSYLIDGDFKFTESHAVNTYLILWKRGYARL